jgi:hypothetical protein
MTTAIKHRERSRRSYGIAKATLGSVERSTYYSRQSRATNAAKSLSMFTKLSTRLKNLSKRLTERFNQSFKKQDRG